MGFVVISQPDEDKDAFVLYSNISGGGNSFWRARAVRSESSCDLPRNSPTIAKPSRHGRGAPSNAGPRLRHRARD